VVPARSGGIFRENCGLTRQRAEISSSGCGTAQSRKWDGSCWRRANTWSLPLAKRRRRIGEMVDHALRKGVEFEKPAFGATS